MVVPHEDDLTLNRKIIDILTRVLDKGDWESTLFLRTSAKRLQQLREEAQALLDTATAVSAQTTDSPRNGYMPVYISLYQADASNLEKWAMLLQDLSKHSISRPIYRDEAHIQQTLKAKFDPSKEGYAVVFVRENDIIKPYAGRIVQDRLGHELLTLAQAAVQIANIAEFVYGENRYTFDGEKLRLQSD